MAVRTKRRGAVEDKREIAYLFKSNDTVIAYSASMYFTVRDTENKNAIVTDLTHAFSELTKRSGKRIVIANNMSSIRRKYHNGYTQSSIDLSFTFIGRS